MGEHNLAFMSGRTIRQKPKFRAIWLFPRCELHLENEKGDDDGGGAVDGGRYLLQSVRLKKE